jgi:DNA-binding transcriptional regulator YbjK
MYIKVNETVFNDVTWSFDHERGTAALLLKTNDSISSIAALFDGDDTVKAYDDNDIETGVWYVTQLLSIYQNYESRTPDEPREVVVSLKATSLSAEAEQSINTSIEEANDALIELASLIEDMEEANIAINRIDGVLEGIPRDIVERFDAMNNAYNELADRVARLENRIQ